MARQLINPSETFGDIVIDYSYVECTSACMTALAAFSAAHPRHRARDIARAQDRGCRFVLKVRSTPPCTAMGRHSLLNILACEMVFVCTVLREHAPPGNRLCPCGAPGPLLMHAALASRHLLVPLRLRVHWSPRATWCASLHASADYKMPCWLGLACLYSG